MELGTAKVGSISTVPETTEDSWTMLEQHCPGTQTSLEILAECFLGATEGNWKHTHKFSLFFLFFFFHNICYFGFRFSKKRNKQKSSFKGTAWTGEKIQHSFQRNHINNLSILRIWMNFTESWSRKAFFKSLTPILSKFGQKRSLIESHSKRKKKKIGKTSINSITTTTHFKVSYLGCMFSFSFCSTVGIYTIKARVNSACC